DGLAIHRRLDVPPFFMPWSYNNARWAQWRNFVAYSLLDRGCQQILSVINEYRQRWNLPPYHQIYASHATLAHLSQQPAAFDFPIPDLPKHFHYVGPLRNVSPRSVPFPYDRLTGQPLIYASLGSVQNTKYDIFRCIAAACEGLDVQLLITHGGGMSAEAARSLPGSPLVVDYAPHVDVLANAQLTITHGGLNTILDSLNHGVPLITIPITFEQPGSAARVRWTRTGEVLPLKRLNNARLRTAVQHVLTEKSYRNNALMMKQSITQAGGVVRAADIIEQSLQPPVQAVERESNRVLNSVLHAV
ncbi:MAG TPA: nucleotide disphospho-sugar-binding domain-containing protein, partial [Crinalium sp.]